MISSQVGNVLANKLPLEVVLPFPAPYSNTHTSTKETENKPLRVHFVNCGQVAEVGWIRIINNETIRYCNANTSKPSLDIVIPIELEQQINEYIIASLGRKKEEKLKEETQTSITSLHVVLRASSVVGLYFA